MNYFFRLLIFSPVLLLGACSVTKYLPPGESLYAGSKVTIDGAGKKDGKALSADLNALVRPRPNKSLLGFRYKVWFYYVAGEPKGKGLRKYVREKLGEEPVFASQVNVEKNRQVLQNRLENKGYFHAQTTGDTVTKSGLTTARFVSNTGPQYRIRNVTWPSDSSEISGEIRAVSKRTLLKPGEPYDLDVIKNERTRIDSRLKNRGFYFFNGDYIIDRVDTTVGDHQVDMFLSIKPGSPTSDLGIYKVNDIWVYPTYSIENDSALGAAPAVPYNDFYVIDPENRFKPRTFERMLIFKKGERYSRRDHNQSLNRLVSLGAFKFVKAKFEEVDTAGNYLDPYYFLTPLPAKSYKLEVTGLTKSNNATGSEVSVSWTHRNAFRGAEQLTLGLFGGLETQVYGGQSIAITRYGVEGNLYFPRVLAPFRLNTKADFVPRTRINLRYEFYSRSNQYTLNSYVGSYGFVWKTRIQTEHQLNILNLNYVQPINIKPEFQLALDTDITLRRSIEPQFILGPSYNFNYNSNARPNSRLHNFYFNFNIEAPGNLLGLITGTEFDKEKQGTGMFLGTKFSQYIRTEVDFRHYLRLGDKNHKSNVLATRVLFGYGLPFGNSQTLPFVKAFFMGGVNDLRAFRARSLGPGLYYVRNGINEGTRLIPDQPGDIKLLASTELRAKLISIVHGAVFVDAGNIWTVREDPNRPGSQFNKDFLNQIAVGAGVGLRFDISFLVIRVDLATPIRKPYLSTGPAFVFDQIQFGDRNWRKENLILNLGLGYPF